MSTDVGYVGECVSDYVGMNLDHGSKARDTDLHTYLGCISIDNSA